MREKGRFIRAQIVLALALMLVGFGFVMQLRTQERLNERLENESEADLAEIIDQLDNEIVGIRGQLLDERIRLMEYRNTNTDEQALLTQAKDEIDDLTKFVGIAGAVGPGIVIDIENEERVLDGLDVRQIVEELRASGAWGISINGRRLDHGSSLWRRAGYVYLDGERLTPRLTIKALGPPRLLYQAITLPRGIRDMLGTLVGVRVTVNEQPEIRIGAVETVRKYRFSNERDRTIKQ